MHLFQFPSAFQLITIKLVRFANLDFRLTQVEYYTLPLSHASAKRGNRDILVIILSTQECIRVLFQTMHVYPEHPYHRNPVQRKMKFDLRRVSVIAVV